MTTPQSVTFKTRSINVGIAIINILVMGGFLLISAVGFIPYKLCTWLQHSKHKFTFKVLEKIKESILSFLHYLSQFLFCIITHINKYFTL